jgi:CRP-like cAMP-binding protein
MNNLARKEAPVARRLNVKPLIPPALRRLIGKLQKNYSFFSEMEEEEVRGFLSSCKQKTYIGGQRIFNQGEPASHFYMLVSGEVSIVVRSHESDTEVARLDPGEIFGEMALLENIPRTASAVTVEESVLFSIPTKMLASRAPLLAYKVLRNITQQLSAKLRGANEQLQIS